MIIDKNKLKKELLDKLSDFYRLSNRDLDYAGVRVLDKGNRFCVEVYGELSYRALMDLSYQLDPIIQKYDKNAYFDAEDSGLLSAWVDKIVSIRDSVNNKLFMVEDVEIDGEWMGDFEVIAPDDYTALKKIRMHFKRNNTKDIVVYDIKCGEIYEEDWESALKEAHPEIIL